MAGRRAGLRWLHGCRRPGSDQLFRGSADLSPADDGYTLLPLRETEIVGEPEVLGFWEREGAVPPGLAKVRIHDVVFVAVDRRDELAAVASVYLQRVERLRMDLWHYRTFVGREHRQSGLVGALATATNEYLEERFVSGKDTRAAGVFVELESRLLKAAMRQAVRPGSRSVFIGEDAEGRHLRVRYFRGALVPPPP